MKKIISLLFIMLGFLSIAKAQNICPNGSQEYNNSCYQCDPSKGYLNSNDRGITCTICDKGYHKEMSACVLDQRNVDNTFLYIILGIAGISIFSSYIFPKTK